MEHFEMYLFEFMHITLQQFRIKKKTINFTHEKIDIHVKINITCNHTEYLDFQDHIENPFEPLPRK